MPHPKDLKSGHSVLEPRRFIGVDLSGAKNNKTTLAVLEYYPHERKTFLLEIYDQLVPKQEDREPKQSSDEALLELLAELKPGLRSIGINIPLELPPCISCTRKTCPLPKKCSVPAVKWMRSQAKSREPITPYTQRPVELWVKRNLIPRLPESHRFEIDEALGGGKAPLTARLQFLKRHLDPGLLIEIWPKLSVAMLALQLGLSKRAISGYRQLDEGSHFREEILHALAAHDAIFIYERDIQKLTRSLSAFDAFICAYTALLAESDQCAKRPGKLPASHGWVHYPDVSLKTSRSS